MSGMLIDKKLFLFMVVLQIILIGVDYWLVKTIIARAREIRLDKEQAVSILLKEVI